MVVELREATLMAFYLSFLPNKQNHALTKGVVRMDAVVESPRDILKDVERGCWSEHGDVASHARAQRSSPRLNEKNNFGLIE